MRRSTAVRVVANPVGAISVTVIVFAVLCAVVPDVIARYGATDSTDAYRHGPSLEYWFGTDNLGRDVYSRTIYGARASVQVGVMSVLIGTLGGTVIGLVGGWFGSGWDFASQRMVDILMALPGILLALMVLAAFGGGIGSVSLAVGLAILPVAARVSRASTQSIGAMAYIRAAESIGASEWHILRRHVAPGLIAPMTVIATIQLGVAIIAEASLSYLGVGIPLGTPSWGNMLGGSSQLHFRLAPWMAVAPGVALTLVVLATNLLGDILRDTLDPRLRR